MGTRVIKSNIFTGSYSTTCLFLIALVDTGIIGPLPSCLIMHFPGPRQATSGGSEEEHTVLKNPKKSSYVCMSGRRAHEVGHFVSIVYGSANSYSDDDADYEMMDVACCFTVLSSVRHPVLQQQGT